MASLLPDSSLISRAQGIIRCWKMRPGVGWEAQKPDENHWQGVLDVHSESELCELVDEEPNTFTLDKL